MNMLEKRRYQRLRVKLPVTLRYQGRLIPATMLNLSCGGACIKADEINLDADSSVEIVFDIDAEQRDISMRGTIVHSKDMPENSRGCTAGVRFSNLFSEGHRTIQEFLRRNLN